MFKINLKTQEAIREELPQFLVGLDKASLVDLNWVDEALRLKGYGYFEEIDTSISPSDSGIYDGTEILHVDMELKVVEVSRGIRAKTEAELTADRKAKVPKEVTMRQARLALHERGLLDTVINAIASSSDEVLKIEWEYARDVSRNWERLVLLATSLGLTDEELDNLFILAGSK